MSDGPSLSQLYQGGEADRLLDERLTRLAEAARGAWPGIALSDEAFVEALARGAGVPPRAPEELHGRGIALARAVLDGDVRALRYLDEVVVAQTQAATRNMAVDADDAAQRVRHRLLVGVNGVPKLHHYTGLGSFEKWVRVVAARCALALLKPEQDVAPLGGEDDELPAMLDGTAPPDMELLRHRHAQDFREAFREALQSLPEREHTVLKLSHLDRLSIDGIGRVYGTHRATAARWLLAARERLLEETRARLARRLNLSDSQTDSLIREVRSDLDVSLRTLFREPVA